MTLSQGYQMIQAASHRQPYLDYPYIGCPDEDYFEPIINSIEY